MDHVTVDTDQPDQPDQPEEAEEHVLLDPDAHVPTRWFSRLNWNGDEVEQGEEVGEILPTHLTPDGAIGYGLTLGEARLMADFALMREDELPF